MLIRVINILEFRHCDMFRSDVHLRARSIESVSCRFAHLGVKSRRGITTIVGGRVHKDTSAIELNETHDSTAGSDCTRIRKLGILTKYRQEVFVRNSGSRDLETTLDKLTLK